MRISVGDANEFLFEVYALDYGDNYHRSSDEPTSELEKAARRIKRRYRNITEYMAALATYQEYMALLVRKHGGSQLFKIKFENDMIEDFVPPQPRMKNTEHNRYLLKNKIMISRSNVKKLDEKRLVPIEDIIREMTPEDEALVADTATRDEVAEKLMKEERFDVNIKEVRNIQSIDYLEEYFRNKNIVKKEEVKPQKFSLTQIVRGDVEPITEDTTEQDDILFYRGNYMNRQTVQDLQVYQGLGDLGWNSLKLMKEKGVSKRVTKLVKNQNKENNKKKKKKQKGRDQNDDFIVSMMMDNDYDSFKDFEEDMLNFTSDNIFK